MSSNDRSGKIGPGARSAAQRAVGGAGGLPTPPPRPGASVAAASAAQSAAEDFAAAAAPRIAPSASAPPLPAPSAQPPIAPTSSLSDEDARAKIARAGLRQLKRAFPAGSGIVHTPTGDASTYKVFERNTRGQRVDYVSTKTDDFPDSTEPKRYEHIASHLTASAAQAALGTAPLSAEESVHARRAATTAKVLADVSEQQRNGGGKHARAALRTVAKGILTPQQVYAGDNPAFPQAKRPKGLENQRRIISGALPVTEDQKRVADNLSESSEDEEVGSLSPRTAIERYSNAIATAADRRRLNPAAAPARRARPASADAADGQPPAVPAIAAPSPSRPHYRTRSSTQEARAAQKHARPEEKEKEADEKRDHKRRRK